MPDRLMETLKDSRDFRKTVDGGSREILETITAYRLPNQTEATRVGISVSRRNGNSVARNRIKRRIREAIRLNASFLPEGEDIVIAARPGSRAAAFEDIENDIKRIGKGKIREEKDK